MRVRRAALLLIIAAACSGADPDFQRAAVSTSVVSTTTTTVATTTTTTAPPPPVELAKAWMTPRGVVVTVLGREGGNVRVLTPCEQSVVVDGGSAIAPPAVILDPGHGGSEPGAVGANGLTEKAVNQAVSEHAERALEQNGVATLLTRTADYRATLEARARLVRELRPRAFVSVHHNADPDGPRQGPGSETYYQVASATSADSKRLAGLIYEEIVRTLSQYQVAWVADRDAGAKYRQNSAGDDYYGILRRTKGVVAVLAELAFVSNPPEAELLARPDVQRAEGEAVARGILRYLTTSDPGSGFTDPYPRSTPAGPGGGRGGCVDPPL